MRILCSCLLLVLLNSCLIVCGKKAETALFISVNAKSKKYLSEDLHEQIHIIYPRNQSPLFIVDNNELFLRIQRTYPEYNLYTVVENEIWDENKLNQIKENRDIQNMLPDPKDINGGINWITEKLSTESAWKNEE